MFLLLVALSLLLSYPASDRARAGDHAVSTKYGSPAADTTRTLEIDVGGALRYNYVYRDWSSASRTLGGTFDFDTFRINAGVAYGALTLGAEYRFYSGYHMLKTGWVGYRFSDALFGQIGVMQVPFGITTYASNSWFFQLPYYAGLEDDHDAGVKLTWKQGRVLIAGAFFKNAEGPFTGSSLASARYSYDVVPAAKGALDYGTAPVAEARANREVNQGNIKATYTVGAGDATAEFGISGQVGGLYNSATGRTGTHRAAAIHLHGQLGRLDAKLQLIGYRHAPENPDGQDDRFVVFGAYDFPYKVASEGVFYSAALKYTVPVGWGPVEALAFYNDYTYLDKIRDAYIDTIQNITGVSIQAGPLFTYVDLVRARNHPFAIDGANFAAALAEGSGAWHTRFNVNIGFYF